MAIKVFQVITESFKENSNELEEMIQYVTSEENTMLSVVEHFTTHCEQYEEDLKSVRDVLSIVQHIGKRK